MVSPCGGRRLTQETVNYNSIQEVKDAKLRTSQRHLDGWRPLNTNNLEIVWSNDPEPTPKLKEQITTRQLLERLAEERNLELI